ncbi:MAG: hypothetical protein QM784_13925 [Polyangiaceae bacterium]
MSHARDVDEINHPARRNFCARHARAFRVIASVSYGVGLLLARRISWRAVMFAALPLAALSYYSLFPLPKSFARAAKSDYLKQIFLLKNVGVAAAISLTISGRCRCR